MKLEAAAGTYVLKTPQASIYHFHMQHTRQTRLFLPTLALYVTAVRGGLCNEKEYSCKWGLWVETCHEVPDRPDRGREGKVPCLVGGVAHTHRHICSMYYHIAYTHLGWNDPMNSVNNRLPKAAFLLSMFYRNVI